MRKVCYDIRETRGGGTFATAHTGILRPGHSDGGPGAAGTAHRLQTAGRNAAGVPHHRDRGLYRPHRQGLPRLRRAAHPPHPDAVCPAGDGLSLSHLRYVPLPELRHRAGGHPLCGAHPGGEGSEKRGYYSRKPLWAQGGPAHRLSAKKFFKRPGQAVPGVNAHPGADRPRSTRNM